MNTIPAREIKRRGIGAVDELLKCGPVHVIKNDAPRYVIMDETRHRDLLEADDEAEMARSGLARRYPRGTGSHHHRRRTDRAA